MHWPSEKSFSFGNIPYGDNYQVFEISPFGYSSSLASGSEDITINSETPREITCTNTQLYGSITLTKTFSPDTAVPVDITFELYHNDSATGRTHIMHWPYEKSFSFGNIPYGENYQVFETSPFGYSSSLASGSEDITINSETPREITCTNTQLYGSITVTKEFSPDTAVPIDITFELYHNDSATGRTHIMHWPSEKSFSFSGLPYGENYQVYETSPFGYSSSLTNGSGDISINSETPREITCTNTQQYGKILVTKAFSPTTSAPTSDVTLTFELYMNDQPTGITKTINYPHDSTCEFDQLTFGDTYKVYETSSMTGFSSSFANGSDAITINSTETYSITCTNTQQYGKIVVIKEFSPSTSAPSSNVDLTFELYKNGQPTGISKTISYPGESSCEFDQLTFGDTYKVYETSSLDGFSSSFANGSDAITINSTESYNITCTNTQILRKVEFKKIVENMVNDTTQFTLQVTGDNGYSGSVTVDETMQTLPSLDLPFGNYTVTEVNKPGYHCNSITPSEFSINSDTETIQIVTACNSKLFGSITLHKAFEGTNTNTSSTNTFAVNVDGTGDTNYHHTVYLDPIGTTQTLSDLPYIGTFQITEDNKNGYQLVSISGDHVNENGEFSLNVEFTSISVTVTNTQLFRKVIFKKVVENVDNDTTQFTLQVTGDNGYSGSVTVDETMQTLPSLDLPFGHYTVTELDKPGYHVNSITPSEFTIDAQTYRSETMLLVTANNSKIFYYGSILVQKYSSFGDGKSPVSGVFFQLLNRTPSDSGFKDPDNVVDTQATNGNGQAIFYNLPVDSVYWVREIKQADGYDINKALVLGPYTIGFNQQAYAEFTNNPVGTISIADYDSATISGGNNENTSKGLNAKAAADSFGSATMLVGAVYGIFASQDFTAAPVATVTTSASGPALSVELPFGRSNPATYYVKEIMPPASFLANVEVQSVTFTAPGQTASLSFKDVRNIGSLIIKKVDALNTTKTLAGAEFTLYSDEVLAHQVGSPVTTGADGIARFCNLVPGTYWVKETKAPTDYDLLPVALSVDVAAGVTNPDPLVITDQYNPPKGIQTGTMDYNILLIGGLVLLAGLLLVVFTRRRRAQR